MTPAFHLRWDDEGRNHRPSAARQVVGLNFILPEDHLVSTPLGASAEQVRDPSLVTCLTAGCRRGDANDVALAHREDVAAAGRDRSGVALAFAVFSPAKGIDRESCGRRRHNDRERR
jgi:hypothetical protein